MAQHNELGKKGEQLAVDFLLENEYDIISRQSILRLPCLFIEIHFVQIFPNVLR